MSAPLRYRLAAAADEATPAVAVTVGGGLVGNGKHTITKPPGPGKPVPTAPPDWTIEFPGVEAPDSNVLTVRAQPGHLAEMLISALRRVPVRYRAFPAAPAGASGRIMDAAMGQGAA